MWEGVAVRKVKVVSAAWKKGINLKVLHSPVIQGAEVRLDLARSLVFPRDSAIVAIIQ